MFYYRESTQHRCCWAFFEEGLLTVDYPFFPVYLCFSVAIVTLITFAVQNFVELYVVLYLTCKLCYLLTNKYMNLEDKYVFLISLKVKHALFGNILTYFFVFHFQEISGCIPFSKKLRSSSIFKKN